MKTIRILTFICFSLLFISDINAQVINPVKSLIKKADKYFDRDAYGIAASLYLEVLQKEDDNNDIKLKLAECYRLLNQPEEAEYIYRQFMDNSFFIDAQDPAYKYYFGLVLEQNGKYSEAREWFELYKEVAPDDKRVQNKLINIENIAIHYQDSAKYEIEGLRINSSKSDFAPRFFRNGIVFVSDRKPPYIEDGIYNPDSIYYRELYYSEILSDGTQKSPTLFYQDLNDGFHKGPVTFYNNEKNMVYTRASRSGLGLDKFSLYFAKQAVDNDEWIEKRAYVFNGKNNYFNVMHPSLNQQGTVLYFASDMPGGFGGTDLYVSVLDENGKWSEPQNLGARINTSEAEIFPYITDNNTLYFSSRGHGGLGGLDIYEVNLNEVEGEVQNLGFPINSNKNDFAITFDKRGYTGYFSSNRDNGEGGSDIYRFKKNIYINGKVTDTNTGLSIPNAYVILAEKNTGKIVGNTTDELGNYRIQLDIDASYLVTIMKDGYTTKNASKISTFGNFENNLNKNIDFNIERDELIVKGYVKNKDTGLPIEGAFATLYDTRALKEHIVQTRVDGSYIFKLEPENVYQLSIELRGFFTKKQEIDTFEPEQVTFTEDFKLKSVVPNLPFLLESTTYNTNKGDIAPENEDELDALALFLKAYPKFNVEVRVHTDAIGNATNNLNVSEDRASYVRYHLIKKGVNPNRISTIGYGEQFLLNGCYDTSDCEESEIKLNRRVEVIFTKQFSAEEEQAPNNNGW